MLDRADSTKHCCANIMSSKKPATNDVFICSGGGSTRYSFVSHLSAALNRINISVIQEKDESPPPESSEYLSKETKSAIKRSKVRVVVLSEEFALYKSSLSSLVEIIDRHHEKNCVAVVPVFYRVHPSVVEQQSEKFYMSSSVPEEQVIKWRNALKETAHLEKSLESKDGQSDLGLVEEIVTYVHKKLYPTDKIGISSRLVEIENLINKQPLGVRSLGIWGMAGIGKTTIAEAVFNRMKGDYEHPRFIRDFEKQFQKKGLYNLREQRLPPNVNEILDITKSGKNSKESQRMKIVFLVLDDVRKAVNAESFLGGFGWFDQGSIIIITSRDRHVLVQCRVDQIYEVKKLDDNESLTLFSECTFGEVVLPKEGYLKVAEMVVEYAMGNAKAISCYGAELKGKTTREEMEAAFFKLKRCPSPEVFELFKSSYDELSDNEKNIFLDIACFFNGRCTEHVNQALKGRGLVVPIGIQYLLEKSLVTITENRVEMHELIRDVAYEILNQEVKNGKVRRLCGAHNIQPLLEDKGTNSSYSLVLEDIESILMNVSGLSFVVVPMAFQRMCNLRFLKIYSTDPEHHPGLNLQSGHVSLPSELRLLHWENYSLQNLPELFNPQNLEELTMPYSQLQKLWEGTKILQSLKTISLQHSQRLVEINQLSEALNLELIDLRGCTSLQSFAATGNLELLQVLNLSGCLDIKSFPKVLPPNVKELYLNGTGIREVPGSIEALSKLVKLDLGNCRELQNFLIKIYNMESLKLLNLSGCIDLKSFPEIAKEMGKLQYLYLSSTGIQELHTSISHMIGLKVLIVSRNLHLPESLKDLKDLYVEYKEETERL